MYLFCVTSCYNVGEVISSLIFSGQKACVPEESVPEYFKPDCILFFTLFKARLHSFFTLFKRYKGNKLCEKNSKEKVLMEARENKFQIISQALRSSRVRFPFVKFEAFEVCYLGLP